MSDELRKITETSERALVRWQKRALVAETKIVRLEDERIVDYRNTRKREAEAEADAEVTEMRLELRVHALQAKLTTFEAAVRELQRWSFEMDGRPDMSRLFALVPEAGS